MFTYPNVESNSAAVCVEHQRMNLNSECGDVLLLEFTCHMTFDECGFAGTSVADQDALESGNIAFSCHI